VQEPLDVQRRRHILNGGNVDLLVDVGANIGDYSVACRAHGYAGSICCFEPQNIEFQTLQARMVADPTLCCVRAAVGDRDGKTTINVSGHQTSSSLLPMTRLHESIMPSSKYVRTEEVDIVRLDSFFKLGIQPPSFHRVYLKLDVQGYEMKVLEGSTQLLRLVTGIELELSVQEVYQGSPGYLEMIQYLENIGFRIVSWTDVLSDPVSQFVIQADAIFVRRQDA